MITKFEKLLSIKELAGALGKHRNYVGAMKARGFEMPGGTALLTEAREWLRKNPQPMAKRPKIQEAA